MYVASVNRTNAVATEHFPNSTFLGAHIVRVRVAIAKMAFLGAHTHTHTFATMVRAHPAIAHWYGVVGYGARKHLVLNDFIHVFRNAKKEEVEETVRFFVRIPCILRIIRGKPAKRTSFKLVTIGNYTGIPILMLDHSVIFHLANLTRTHTGLE